jgi:putative transposase
MEGIMARLARVVAPGYPHHITQRGNRRQPTFFQDSDYKFYLSLLQDRCRKSQVEIWAYCLMPNHVHLIVVPETKDGLRKAIGETHRRYTQAINKRMGWRGYLWQGRFASFPMDETYLLAATRYVERNPVQAGLVKSPQEYSWSSAAFHSGKRPDPVVCRSPFNEMIGGWVAFLQCIGDESELKKIKRSVRVGRPLGSDAFVGDLEKQLRRVLQRKKPGPKRKQLKGHNT